METYYQKGRAYASALPFSSVTRIYSFLSVVAPSIKLPAIKARKKKNIALAIEAASATMPVKPSNPAMIAMDRNVNIHFNIMM